MSIEDTDGKKEYEVGYGKPPQGGKFKKGESGNVHGSSAKMRAKKAKKSSFSDFFGDGMQRPVEIEENGKKTVITRMHLGVRKRVEAAAKGDIRALRELFKLRDVKEAGPLAPVKQVVFSLAQVRAAGPLGNVLYRPNVVLLKQPKSPISGGPAKRHSPAAEESLPRQSISQLIEQEFDREIRVTVAATGETRRMTMREVIAEQLVIAFSTNKRGAADLMIKLNRQVTEDGEDFKKVYVSVPWNYELPPKLPRNWRETMRPPAADIQPVSGSPAAEK